MITWVDFGNTSTFMYYGKEKKIVVADIESPSGVSATLKKDVEYILDIASKIERLYLKQVIFDKEKNLFFAGFVFVEDMRRSTKDFIMAKAMAEKVETIVCGDRRVINVFCEVIKQGEVFSGMEDRS